MLREPPLQDFPPYLKMLSLIAIVICSFLVVLIIGIGLAMPFYGLGVVDKLSTSADTLDKEGIGLLKYFQIVNQVGVFILPTVIFVILTDTDFGGYLKLDRTPRKLSLLLGTVVIFITLPFINWLLDINGSLSLPESMHGIEQWMRNMEDDATKLTDAFLKTPTIGGFLLNLLMIALIAAIGEELIFRGILVRLFHEWTRNVHMAVILPALIFSALHLQFYGFIPRLVLGILLGYLFVWTGSLWVPVLVHFVNNAMAVILAFLDSRGLITVDIENIGASDNVVVIILSFIFTVVLMGWVYYTERGKPAILKSKSQRNEDLN
jgi:membrane protease YdiL (CAAX protease family)